MFLFKTKCGMLCAGGLAGWGGGSSVVTARMLLLTGLPTPRLAARLKYICVFSPFPKSNDAQRGSNLHTAMPRGATQALL